jgi:hypothetical protein
MMKEGAENDHANVRFGSLGDMAARPRHVRFTPNSGHKSGHRFCPLSANSRHRASASLNDTIEFFAQNPGETEEREKHHQA